MANLFGTGINQVPTNGMLGNLAFQDKAYVSVDKVGIGTTAVDTGTANQTLQNYGGAYISGDVGIGRTTPQGRLHLPYNGTLGNQTLRIGNEETTFGENIYSIFWGSSSGDTQTGMGPYPSARGIWSRQGLAIHVKSSDEFSVKSTGWDNLFGVQGAGNVYVKNILGVGVTNPVSTTKVAIAGTLGISEVGGAGNRTLLTSSTAGFVLNHNDNSQITFQTQGTNRLTYSHASNFWNIPSATPFIVGSGSSSGTASQTLQVTGGAYVSGDVGIGITNPESKSHIGISGAGITTALTLDQTGGNAVGVNLKVNYGGYQTSRIVFDFFGNEFISASPSGSHGMNYVSGRTNFSNHWFRNASNATQMVLNNSGNLLIGSESDIGQRLQVTGGGYISGNLGLGVTNPSASLQLAPTASISNVGSGITLGGTVGSALTIAQFSYTNLNGSFLRFKATRNEVGSNWQTASTKILQVTDVTEQSYIEFNPIGSWSGGGAGLGFGGATGEWARFNASGNLGIGTTNPAEPFHFLNPTGFARFENSINNYSILVRPDSNGPKLYFGSAGNNSFLEFGAFSTTNNIDTKSRDFKIYSTASTNAFILKQDTGNVGVGTTNPVQKLDVFGNIRLTGEIHGPSELVIDPAAIGNNTGAVRIKGDLYVDGTQTFINSTTLELADFNVGIATTVGTNALLDGAGIGIGSTNIRKSITWENSSSSLRSSENWKLPDAKKILLGDGNDLEIYHSGTNSHLAHVGTNDLYIQSVNGIYLQTVTNEAAIYARSNGAIELYHDTFKRLETTGYGATVFGTLESQGLNITGINTISVNTTTNALRITQLGSGNALVVEDETNPDSTPFVVTGAGDVGIGTNIPQRKLHLRASVGDGIYLDNSDQTGNASGPAIRVRGQRIDGNASQVFSGQLVLEKWNMNAAIASNTHLGAIIFGGNHHVLPGITTGMTYGASIGAISEGTFSDAVTAPTAIVFNTGTVGVATFPLANLTYGTEAARITSNRNLLINATTETGTASQRLQVIGGGYISTRLGIGQTNPNTALHVGPYNGDTLPHLYLASGNNLFGWRIDTQDFGAGSVPLRIFRRVNGTDTESITALNSNGNLGVGVTVPNSKVTIGGETSQFPYSLQILSTLHATSRRASVALGGTIGTQTPDWQLLIDSQGTGTKDLSIYSTALANNVFRIDQTGNTVIQYYPLFVGTSSSTGTASQPLQVTGSAYVSGTLGIGRTNPGVVSLDVNGIARIGASASGKVVMGSGMAANDFGLSILPYSDRTELQAEQQGVSYRPLILNPISGNIGIGTTNPSSRLDVFSGNIRSYGSSAPSFIATPTSGSSYIFGANTLITGGGIYDNTAGAWRLVAKDTSGNILIGDTNETGTASQKLQVTGGAYVSGNLGVGTTRPLSRLFVTQPSTDQSTGEGATHAFAISSGNTGRTMWMGYDDTVDAGYINAAKTNESRPIYIQTRNLVNNSTVFVGIGTTRPSGAIGQFLQVGGGAYFNGNVGVGLTNPSYNLHVNGSFAATTKSFIIQHPTKPGKQLRYASLEGPENGVYVRGRSQDTTIQLPDYWTGLVDQHSISVNLTPIGDSSTPRIKEIVNNQVIVFSNEEGELDYFYTVYAERVDVEKLEVEI